MRPVKAPVVVVGLGQLGAAFSEAFLKLGHPVIPVLRGGSIATACASTQEPALILLAVGEDDLKPALREVPEAYHHKVALLQNELRPDQWLCEMHNAEPTVAIVWFEKKPGKVAHPVLPSVLYGSQAALLSAAFEKLALPARTVDSQEELGHELALKNLYILGLNLSGLACDGNAGTLLEGNETTLEAVSADVLALEQKLLEVSGSQGFSKLKLDCGKLKADLRGAILADPSHGCAGRSAPRRLARTLELAQMHGLQLKTLRSIQKNQ